MMCCQPKDIRNVFLIVYKNCKNRLRNKELFVITCDTFVGFESGWHFYASPGLELAGEVEQLLFTSSGSLILLQKQAQRIRSAIKYHLETQSICFAIECRSQQQKKKVRAVTHASFMLKKERNTLCVITRCDVVVVAFASVENLICWESWLHQTCFRGAMLYAQLIDAPESSRARSLLNREVRVHIHDGRFALVEGRPARVIGFWNTSDILRVGFRHNVMHFVTVHGLVEDEGVFALVCGQIQQLARFFHLAKRPVSFLHLKVP
ncbi:unnamed protein product [Toxocara canis]|uniref:CNH domain-containing protein n=1 Tax=Toxocara canis TaxID=6265 RepID=A0A183VBE8_TOXCA|nr:unnamed protein product [Toxocara canis]